MAITKNNKYLGKNGLVELMNLLYAEFQKKQDWVQFPEMPNAADYVGKVVQYTGTSNDNFTKGYFYYSNGVAWVLVNTSSMGAVVICKTALPDWNLADSGLIYFVVSENKSYVRDDDTEGNWFDLAVAPIAKVKKYVDSVHYDPDAEYDDAGEEFEFDGLEIESFTDEEIKDLYEEA